MCVRACKRTRVRFRGAKTRPILCVYFARHSRDQSSPTRACTTTDDDDDDANEHAMHARCVGDYVVKIELCLTSSSSSSSSHQSSAGRYQTAVCTHRRHSTTSSSFFCVYNSEAKVFFAHHNGLYVFFYCAVLPKFMSTVVYCRVDW